MTRKEWHWITLTAALVGLAIFLIYALHNLHREDFERQRASIDRLLAKAKSATEARLREGFIKAAASNPTFALLVDENGAPSHSRLAWVGNENSERTDGTSFKEWGIRLLTPSPELDFSKGPYLQALKRVSVTLRLIRDRGLIPRPPRIEIMEHGAPDDGIFLDLRRGALRAEGLEFLTRP